jgi:hypothetical protein
MFHNAHEYRETYGDAPAAPARYCAPRPDHGYEVEAARAKIEQRAGLRTVAAGQKLALRGCIDVVQRNVISGWAQNPDYPEAAVCLDIYAGGELIGQTLANRYRADLEHAGLGSGRHSFDFTPLRGQDLACIEVRRSLDGAALNGARTVRKVRPSIGRLVNDLAGVVNWYDPLHIGYVRSDLGLGPIGNDEGRSE